MKLDYLDIGSREIPTTAAAVVEDTCWLQALQIINQSGAPATITLTDKETGRVVSIITGLVTGSESYQFYEGINYPGRLCRGGIIWVASAGGVTGYIRYARKSLRQ